MLSPIRRLQADKLHFVRQKDNYVVTRYCPVDQATRRLPNTGKAIKCRLEALRRVQCSKWLFVILEINANPSHPERSEGSRWRRETLRYAQNDRSFARPKITQGHLGLVARDYGSCCAVELGLFRQDSIRTCFKKRFAGPEQLTAVLAAPILAAFATTWN